MSSKVNKIYEFGPFRLDASTSAVWRGDELIPLAPKSVELLALLADRNGEIISKQEIFDSVWSDTFVEDGVLTQNIYSIRRALGKKEDGSQYIENVPRRGYRFAADITVINGEGDDAAENAGKREAGASEKPNAETSGPKWWIAAAFSVLVTAAAGAYFYLRPGETVMKTPANLEFHHVTDTGDIFFPTLSPDGNFIAYSRGNLGDRTYIKDVRTNEEKRLVVNGVRSIGFSQFSNESQYIYGRTHSIIFVPADVVRVSVSGGDPTVVATNVWGNFSISPDEKQMAFVRIHPDENRQAVIVKDLATGAEKEVSTRHAPLDYYLRAYPAWSPDGKKLAVVAQRSRFQYDDLLVIDLETQQERKISTGELTDVQQAVWISGDVLAVSARTAKNYQLWSVPYTEGKITPITNDIASHRFLDITADRKKLLTMEVLYYSNIWTAEAENLAEQTQLTFGTSRNDGYFGIDWFPNGDIIYSTNNGPGNEWNLQTLGSAPKQLTDAVDGERNDYPEISPDGNSIYFTSNRAGAFTIWRSAADGSGAAQVTPGEKDPQLYPQISPDGEWLYYIKKLERSSAVWRRSISTGNEEKLTSDKFAPAEFLSLSPDGKYLAFHNLTGGQPIDVPGPVFNIGVLEIGGSVQIFHINSAPGRIFFYWTPDSNALVYDSFTPNETKLWRQPLDGSEPESILSLPNERIFFVDWSDDGKMAAFARGRQIHNALILTNFE